MDEGHCRFWLVFIAGNKGLLDSMNLPVTNADACTHPKRAAMETLFRLGGLDRQDASQYIGIKRFYMVELKLHSGG